MVIQWGVNKFFVEKFMKRSGFDWANSSSLTLRNSSQDRRSTGTFKVSGAIEIVINY